MSREKIIVDELSYLFDVFKFRLDDKAFKDPETRKELLRLMRDSAKQGFDLAKHGKVEA